MNIKTINAILLSMIAALTASRCTVKEGDAAHDEQAAFSFTSLDSLQTPNGYVSGICVPSGFR